VNELLVISCDLAREKGRRNTAGISLEIAEIYWRSKNTFLRCNRLHKIIQYAAMDMDKVVIKWRR